MHMTILYRLSTCCAAGTQHMYVHVAATNVAAQRLYLDTCGFAVEQEENPAIGRAMNRAQHYLLHKHLRPQSGSGPAF